MRYPTTLGAALLIVLAGCGAAESSTGPNRLAPLRIIEGDQLTDTIFAKPIQALIVEVRDSAGALRRGAVVRFEAMAHGVSGRQSEAGVLVSKLSSNTFTSFSSDSTDAQGRAKALVQMGSVAGMQRVLITVPDQGIQDTATYTVVPGNATRLIIKVRDTTAYVNAQYTIGATAADRYSNGRPADLVTYTAGPLISSVSSAGVVSTGSPARTWIAVAAGAAKDTARVTVVPHGSLLVMATQAYPNPNVIASVDLDGSNFRVLTTVNSDHIYPAWSPDGSQVIYYQPDNAGANHTRVFVPSTNVNQPLLRAGSGLAADWGGRFSPDGRWVYFSGQVPGGTVNVYRVAADGSGTPEALAPPGQYYTYNSFSSVSADGTKLLYLNESSRISVLDVSTKKSTVLSVGGALPVFTPDGKSIVYQSGFSGLLVANADGTGSHQFSPSGGYYSSSAGLDVSPDGQWVVVRGGAKLELIRISDGLDLVLTYAGNMYQPTFHP